MSDVFSSLLDLLDEGVCLTDPRGIVTHWSAAAERITGLPAAEVVGRQLGEIVPESLGAFGGENARSPIQVTVCDREGGSRALVGRARALSGGADSGWLWVFQGEQRIREIDQLKAEFVGTISHELRTPLTSIKAYTATLRTNPNLEESVRGEFLQIVEQEADRLTRLVDDLLVVARVDSGFLLKHRQRVSLRDLFDRVLSNLARDEARHPIRLEVDGIEASGDPDRLHEVFANLLENAVKYSPGGGEIRIRAERYPDGSKVMVRDSGIGIPAGELSYIFDKFYRIDNHLTASVGGSGLGLYIAQSIVRAHGGTIEVASVEGEGTTFTVCLPDRNV